MQTWPTGQEGGSAAYAYGAWINSCIHVIMYFYCAHAAATEPPQPNRRSHSSATLVAARNSAWRVCALPLRAPRLIARACSPCVLPPHTDGVTALGIKPPSMVKKSVTTSQLTQFASCIVHAITALALDSTPIFYNAVQVAYHIGMLKLFLPLLLGKKGPGAKKGDGKPVPPTPAQKDVTKTQ